MSRYVHHDGMIEGDLHELFFENMSIDWLGKSCDLNFERRRRLDRRTATNSFGSLLKNFKSHFLLNAAEPESNDNDSDNGLNANEIDSPVNVLNVWSLFENHQNDEKSGEYLFKIMNRNHLVHSKIGLFRSV